MSGWPSELCAVHVCEPGGGGESAGRGCHSTCDVWLRRRPPAITRCRTATTCWPCMCARCSTSCTSCTTAWPSRWRSTARCCCRPCSASACERVRGTSSRPCGAPIRACGLHAYLALRAACCVFAGPLEAGHCMEHDIRPQLCLQSLSSFKGVLPSTSATRCAASSWLLRAPCAAVRMAARGSPGGMHACMAACVQEVVARHVPVPPAGRLGHAVPLCMPDRAGARRRHRCMASKRPCRLRRCLPWPKGAACT